MLSDGVLSVEAVMNWQQQVDEVQALEAIYGEDFRILESSGISGSSANAAGSNGDAGAASSSSNGGTSAAAMQPPPLDAASLALLDTPCSSSWVLDCSLMVQMEPPSGSLRLQIQEQDHGGSSGGGGGGEGAAAGPSSSGRGGGGGGGYQVQYLPPVCMQLRLAERYPSERPPEVSLSALWLSSRQAAELEQQLLQVWHEQGPGAPACYSWADWLQSSALQHLGAAQTLSLADERSGRSSSSSACREEQQQSAGGGPSSGADGDVPDSDSVAEDKLMKLLRYNALGEHQAFQEATHTCGICLEDQPGRDFVRLDCRHAWCQGCLAEQARIHVSEGALELLRCPDPQCGAQLAPAVLQRVLAPDDYLRWEQLTLQRTLDTMPDVAYCPRCNSISLEDSDSCAQCPKCLFVFCSLCMGGWHPGTQCVSSETKLAMLRRKMEGGGRAALDDLRRQEQDLLSMAQIEKTAKKCPKCGMATQKSEGCNKITCGGCSAYWCWRCGKEIDGYRHFRTGECILFDEAEILRWEAQWEEMQAAARVMAAGMRNDYVGETAAARGRARGCFCPQCGQINHKMGNNNHMQCWSCTSHFCYSCRSVLRGKGGTHFGPKGCKQHSPD